MRKPTHLVFEDDHQAERLLRDEIYHVLVVAKQDVRHVHAFGLVLFLWQRGWNNAACGCFNHDGSNPGGPRTSYMVFTSARSWQREHRFFVDPPRVNYSRCRRHLKMQLTKRRESHCLRNNKIFSREIRLFLTRSCAERHRSRGGASRAIERIYLDNVVSFTVLLCKR